MTEKFKVGLTRDFLTDDGKLVFEDIGLSLLDEQPHIEYSFFKEHFPEIQPDQIRGLDGVIVLAPKVTRDTLKGADRLVVIARFGVGYESVDLDACTDHNVAVFTTPGAVERPMAGGIMAFLLALSRKMLIKDRLIRAGRWKDKIFHMGIEFTGRTLGSVGIGNIGSEMFRLAKPFGFGRFLAYDPYVTREKAEALGVELVNDLDTIFRESDFVTVNCPLTKETAKMIGERQFRLMKKTAYFVNTARGGIVDQKALTRALKEGWIAGAGIDVFEQEPVDPNDPLLQLENVIVTAHCIGWTHEAFRDIGRMGCIGIIKASRGEIPDHVVNKAVLQKKEFLDKLAQYKR
jgi:D-3-phosphoglycerate dehydrogenase